MIFFNVRQVRTQISLSKDEELSETYSQHRRRWFSDLPIKKQVSIISMGDEGGEGGSLFF